jgi:succinate dehydrogenase flavin-adding protein (antitoxin of CptAB toxin-antitoxin module)
VQFQIGLPRLEIDKNKTYKWVINSGDNDMWRMMFNVTQAWTNIDIKDIEIIHALREAK